MTAVGQVPGYVAANIARRLAADTRGIRCTYGCRAATRLYPCGVRCDTHAPWAQAGNPDPVTRIDPTRTAVALRDRLIAGATR